MIPYDAEIGCRDIEPAPRVAILHNERSVNAGGVPEGMMIGGYERRSCLGANCAITRSNDELRNQIQAHIADTES